MFERNFNSKFLKIKINIYSYKRGFKVAMENNDTIICAEKNNVL